jgi:hypothetical protein
MISLDKIAKINAFKVPQNYFDELPLSIQQRIELDEEPNLILPKTQILSTPEGYFDGLSSKIFAKIGQIEQKSINLEALERVNVFKVPDDYFQNLELTTNIERFGKTNVFNVPNNYFETLPDKILAKTQAPKETKVIKVNWFSGRVKWSAAASIVLFIGLWFAVPQLTKDKTELALEKVSNEDIKTYLETQDLSYLEYESATKNTQNTTKTSESTPLDGLKIDKQDILEHLENQDLEEDI